jgi:hypothetical protein
VDRISRYTAGMTQGQFARDEKTVEAVCFALRRRPCACTGPGGALKKPMKAAFIHLPIRGEMARVQID